MHKKILYSTHLLFMCILIILLGCNPFRSKVVSDETTDESIRELYNDSPDKESFCIIGSNNYTNNGLSWLKQFTKNINSLFRSV